MTIKQTKTIKILITIIAILTIIAFTTFTITKNNNASSSNDIRQEDIAPAKKTPEKQPNLITESEPSTLSE